MSRLLNYYEDFDKPVPPHTAGEKRTISCDLAVIGGGGAGLSAAVRASELGAKVILIEKMTELGGNTRLAGGLLCTNSRILQNDGIPDTTEAHIDTYRRQHLYQLDSSIYERFIRNTGRYYDWLAEKGLDTENRRVVMDKVVMIRDRTTWEPLHNPAYGPGLMGSAVTDTLIRLIQEDKNILTLLTTEATSLQTDEYGSVIGLNAIGGGFNWDIKASNTVLASGGFGSNNEMLKKYFPQYFSSDNYFTHYCLNHCTGDGILMASLAGAETGKKMSIGLEAMVHMPGAYTLQRMMGQPQGVIVGATGRRFVSEDDIGNGEFAMDEQPDGLGWYVFTQGMTERLYQLAVENSRFGDWMPPIDVLYQDMEKELSNGLLVKGNTVAELAAGIGAPVDTLTQSLAQYEKFCIEGCDHQFCKDPKYLESLGTEGPWFAIRLVRKFDVTMGGVSVDNHIRALRPDGSAIRGLYVCGDVASNWMGSDYGPLFSSFAWAVNSGFLAAEECCGQ